MTPLREPLAIRTKAKVRAPIDRMAMPPEPSVETNTTAVAETINDTIGPTAKGTLTRFRLILMMRPMATT